MFQKVSRWWRSGNEFTDWRSRAGTTSMRNRTEGATLIDFALIAALIALVACGAMVYLDPSINNKAVAVSNQQ